MAFRLNLTDEEIERIWANMHEGQRLVYGVRRDAFPTEMKNAPD